MDLHIYRNSQDRWHDLRSAARDRGAILAVNAVTLDELVERITPDAKTASAGQRLVLVQQAIDEEARSRKPEAGRKEARGQEIKSSPVPTGDGGQETGD